jgi:hypothetical protein
MDSIDALPINGALDFKVVERVGQRLVFNNARD